MLPDKHITLSSKDRTSGSSQNPIFKLSPPIQNIRLIKSFQVVLNYSWYNVMTGINDKIYITVAGPTTYTATLTQGNYANFTAFVTMAQTAINTAYTPDNNFTLTYSTTTNKMTLTHSATNFQLTFGTNTTGSARRLLGFSASDTTSGLSATSDLLASLTHDDTLFIKSRALASTYSYASNSATTRNNMILPIPINNGSGGLIVFRALGEDWVIVYNESGGRTLTEIDLGVYFEDMSTLVPLNGMDWRITFQCVDYK